MISETNLSTQVRIKFSKHWVLIVFINSSCYEVKKKTNTELEQGMICHIPQRFYKIYQ